VITENANSEAPVKRPDLVRRPRSQRRRLLPLRVDAAQAAELFSVGLRTWRMWDAAGRVPRPVRIGSRVLWSYRELMRWDAAGMPDRDQWEAIKAARREKGRKIG